jgi:ABC-2 type transport system ATP-binding protein
METGSRKGEDAAIVARDLSKFYGSHRGVEGVDLAIRSGEVFGFLGPNGAGKTTTLRLLLDLIRPTRGRAAILGRDCRRESLAVRRLVGYLPGEFNLYDGLTGRQLLAYLGALGGGPDWTRVEELAGRLGADLGRTIRDLSHGNKQKLAVIQAFMQGAPVLILDEPTSGLDPLVQQEFFALVREARAGGTTIFLSSHNLTEVERICDRVGSVRDGRLVAVETMAGLRARAIRIVRLVCERPPAADALAGLPGLSDLRIDGTTVRCRVRGPVGALLAAAAPAGIVDVLSREPSLEEFFLALYGERGDGDAHERLPEDPA